MPYLGAVQLATTTLGSSASSVTFSNIPTKLNGLYLRDLIIVAKPIVTDIAMLLRFNSDATSNAYSWLYAYGDVTQTGRVSSSGTSLDANGVTGEAWMGIYQIMDFAATDKHKTVLQRTGRTGGNAYTLMQAGTWANTSAITSVSFFNGTFLAGSTFSLYATVRKP